MSIFEDYDSVDLTEDENSREEEVTPQTTISYPERVPEPDILWNMTPSPPPLIPIPRLISQGMDKMVQNRSCFLNGGRNLGKVSIEHEPSTNLPQNGDGNILDIMKNKRTIYTSNIMDTVCLDSDDEEQSCNQQKSKSLQKAPVEPNIDITQFRAPDESGKLLLIKKNNKIYRVIIPHNVVPTTSEAGSNVLINIPEIGPLMIKMDPQATRPPQKNTQLAPFSLNFDNISSSLSAVQSATSSMKKIKPLRFTSTTLKKPNQPVNSTNQFPAQFSATLPNNSPAAKVVNEKIISNKEKVRGEPKLTSRFCWSYTKVKRKNSKVLSDMLGFNKTECRIATKCLGILETIVYKKNINLLKMIKSYQPITKSAKDQDNINSVKFNEIYGKSGISKVFAQLVDSQQPETTSKTKSDSLERCDIQNVTLPPNTIINYDDLLMTRKVVILNKLDSKRKRRKKRLSKPIYKPKATKNIKDGKEDIPIKECFVKMMRDDYVEKYYRNYCEENLRKKMDLDSPCSTVRECDFNGEKNSVEVNKHSPYKSNPSGEQRKCAVSRRKSNQNPVEENISLYDAFSTKRETKCTQIKNLFLSKLIVNERQLKTEMSYIKPVLVINEFNFAIVKFSAEFSRSNIVLPVKKSRLIPKSFLTNMDLVTAVEVGYIKLVDSDLLCEYLTGKIGPTSIPTDEM